MKRILLILGFFILYSTVLNAQQRWMKIYHDEDNSPRRNIINSYDKGILLTVRQKPNWPRYSYLIKTDINGEILWEKTLGDGINGILNGGLGMNSDGDIYFSGSYGEVGAYDDPMILKLNACGEKEWCWLFPTEGYHDYGYGLTITPDGGVAFILNETGENLIDDRICLARFASDGSFLWKECYNLPDTVAMNNEIAYEVITTPDSGFLLTGDCYFINPADSIGSRLCPYYIKTDSDGKIEWYNVTGFHPNVIAGEGRQTVISPDSNYYYSAIRHNFWGNGNYGKSSPALLKIDMQGNEVGVYDIAQPNYFGVMSSLKFASDTTISVTASWGAEWDLRERAHLLDTLGNTLEQTVLLETEYTAITEVSSDKKLFYFVEDLDENDNFDAFLFKLKQTLESDSLYTQWFEYDSLCPYQISSDTIPIEGCGLIVGNKEIVIESEKSLEVFPNPTSKSFTVKSVHLEQGGILQLINMQGQIALQENVPSGTTNYEVDVSDLMKGIYLVKFKSDKGKEVSTKLIVN